VATKRYMAGLCDLKSKEEKKKKTWIRSKPAFREKKGKVVAMKLECLNRQEFIGLEIQC
jgi:hypothetical protein